jgi:hypothetical protein
MPVSIATELDRVVCSQIASMDITGSAEYSVLQNESVSIANIDYEFNLSLSDASAVNFLKCFGVTGNGPSNGFAVSISDKPALHGFIQDAITDATRALQGANAGNSDENNDNVNCSATLRNDLWNELQAELGVDGLLNTVEDSNVSNVQVTLDASGGAWNMVNGLDGSQDDLNLLYTQIPQTTLNLYMTSEGSNEAAVGNYLLMKKADKITFVFNVSWASTVSVTVTQDDITEGAPGADVTTGNVANSYLPTGTFTSYAPTNKRCAFTITLGDGNAGDAFNFA